MAFRTFLIFLILAFPLSGHTRFPDGSLAQDASSGYYADDGPYEEADEPGDYYGDDPGNYGYDNTLYPDSAAVSEPVTIDRKAWNALTDDAAFHYIRQETAPEEAPAEASGMGRMFRRLMEFLSGAGSWIIWILAGGIIIFVLYKILSHLNLGRKDILKPAAAAPDTARPAEDIETLLARSLSERRTTDAVSYMYQHIILLMQQRNVIRIRQETTNSEILRMTRSLPYHSELRKLINRFEYVYFGEYPVSDEQFSHYRHTYQTLKQQLSQADTRK